LFFVSQRSRHPRYLHSFPTRRSSDLIMSACGSERPPCTSSSSTLSRHAESLCDSPTTGCSLYRSSPRARERMRASRTRIQCTFRSEEHTSELQSRGHLVCRLLLEKKK